MSDRSALRRSLVRHRDYNMSIFIAVGLKIVAPSYHISDCRLGTSYLLSFLYCHEDQ